MRDETQKVWDEESLMRHSDYGNDGDHEREVPMTILTKGGEEDICP